MNNSILLDANKIYEAGTKAINSASFKRQSHLYEINHLVNTIELLDKLRNNSYQPSPRYKIYIKRKRKSEKYMC